MPRKKCGLKILFIASSGGHLRELSSLFRLTSDFDSMLITERTNYAIQTFDGPVCFVPQVNRKELLFPLKMLMMSIQELITLIRFKPDVLISTGALCAVPIIFFASKMETRIIYIESLARIKTLSLTGKFALKRADRFYVQWESLLRNVPSAHYEGKLV